MEAGVDLKGDRDVKRIKLNEHKIAVPIPAKVASAKDFIELNKQRIKQQSEKN